MAVETVPAPGDGALRGIGDALRRAYRPAPHDEEERAERRALRKIDIREAVGK